MFTLPFHLRSMFTWPFHLRYLMGNLLCSLLGMDSSLLHHSVTLYLTLPMFTRLFFVNTSWHGASFTPLLRQPLLSSISFCGFLPYSANLHMAILCEKLWHGESFVPRLRQPLAYLFHTILWFLACLCHIRHLLHSNLPHSMHPFCSA